MSSTKSKLRLSAAFAALAALALAVSCRGFFPPTTLQSIALQPPTPTIAVGFQQQMQAWGTDSNNNRSLLTSNVVWELTDISGTSGGSVANITAGGLITGTSTGTATVQASSEGISATTTATIVEIVNSMKIEPGSGSIPDDDVTFAGFTITGVVQTASGTETEDLTPFVTLTAYLNGTAVSTITCTYVSTADQQQCVAAAGTVSTTQEQFNLVVTYGGYSGPQVAASLTVTPAS